MNGEQRFHRHQNVVNLYKMSFVSTVVNLFACAPGLMALLRHASIYVREISPKGRIQTLNFGFKYIEQKRRTDRHSSAPLLFYDHWFHPYHTIQIQHYDFFWLLQRTIRKSNAISATILNMGHYFMRLIIIICRVLGACFKNSCTDEEGKSLKNVVYGTSFEIEQFHIGQLIRYACVTLWIQ